MTLFESRKLVNCKRAALSHALDKIGRSDIGLVFAGSSLSPDLRIGTISAFFHGSGKVLKVKELLIRLVIMGAITGELSFRILALTLINLIFNLISKLIRRKYLYKYIQMRQLKWKKFSLRVNLSFYWIIKRKPKIHVLILIL